MIWKMLIVEDQEVLLALLGEIFADRDDYRIHSAREGEEAHRIAKEIKPDIVLLDFQLPTMNGTEVCRLIKSNSSTSHAKVLMLSGTMRDSEWQRAQEAGADAFVSKPFRIAALREAVENLLKSN